MEQHSEVAHGMQIDWDAGIPMEDGIVLRADIFRPIDAGQYPVILSYGPYGKGLAFQEGFSGGWDRLVAAFPEVAEGTSNTYANFEVVDPEKWVPDGYICIRVDARGSGNSPGFLSPKSIRETQDMYQCIEWAAVQSWSNGKVGLNGISYYATNQWYVASMQPPHLAAICVWEGAADYYRDNTHHGGILSQFMVTLYDWLVWRVQYGVGENGLKSKANGHWISGDVTLPLEELMANRINIESSLLSHPLDDVYYKDRSANWSKITVPFLSAANWGGQGLHPRGNFEGFMRANSSQKWLEAHGLSHWTHFYTNYGVELQKRFFGHFLKGENTGWDKQAPVQLQVRHVDQFVQRAENEWPLQRTQWSKFYLNFETFTLDETPSANAVNIAYDPMGDGVQFLSKPFDSETEITGPLAAKLFVASASNDADIFLVFALIDPEGKEVTFQGSNDPHTPIGLGWLRASHRKLDKDLTLPYRPYHTHDEIWPLTPGKAEELDIEIWPTCIVVPKGYRVALTIKGNDYHYDGPTIRIPGIGYEMFGVGPFVHTHPTDRPAEIFNAQVSLESDSNRQPYLLLPIIPKKEV
jgi:predicted acyl esterase